MATDLQLVDIVVDSVCIHRKGLLRKPVHGAMSCVVKDSYRVRPVRLYTRYAVRIGAIEAAGLSI